MKSTNCYCHKKELWRIIGEGILTINNKPAYQVKIGEWYDYDAGGDIATVMLKEVYEKIMNEEYRVVTQPYNSSPIVVKDEKGKKVSLL